MSRRRDIVVASIVAGMAAGAFAACSFPDVSFDDAEDGHTDGSPGTSDTGAPDANADVDSAQPDVDPDGGSQEASVYDAAGKVDASGCTTCDCDGDGFNFEDGGCSGGPTSGFDCDDTDKSINQGITDFVVSKAWPSSVWSPPYDWNCDGTVTKQYAYSVSCNALQLGANCSAVSGFMDAPECGASGTFIRCKQGFLGLLGCAVDDTMTETRMQGCK